MSLGAGGTQPASASLSKPHSKVQGSTRTQLAESETFAGLVSPAARLVQITLAATVEKKLKILLQDNNLKSLLLLKSNNFLFSF